METAALFDRHPYLAAALAFAMTLVIFLASGAVAAVMDLPGSSVYLIALAVLGAVVATALTLSRWWREAGFRAPYERRLLWLFWLPFVPFIVNLVGGGIYVTDPSLVLVYFLIALLAGLVEESVFRGFVLRALLPIGAPRAALISALLFGTLHVLNALASSSLAQALLQVGYATAIGFGYAALVLRTGTIWPLILAHFLTNFAGFMASGSVGTEGAVATGDMIISALYIVVFSGYGVYLLRAWRRRRPAVAQG